MNNNERNKTDSLMASTKPHKVVMLVYPDAQILDITGPLEVFGRAGRWLRDNKYTPDLAYTVEIVASKKGALATSSGLKLVAERDYSEIPEVDTFLITGGIGYKEAMANEELLAWVKTAATNATRVGSICTGALVLAKTGMLDGLNATTHWAYCDELAKNPGNISVDDDAIFVKNGKMYTSAGVTAGMDMALAMIEEDWGNTVALAIAQELVMFLKRPGGQSQFSRFLEAQKQDKSPIRDLQFWMLEHLDENLSVEILAQRVAMSPRTFARKFRQEVRNTPARYVERIRIEAARRFLEESTLPVKKIAYRVGFTSEDVLRRPFLKLVGVTPSEYRKRFGFNEKV